MAKPRQSSFRRILVTRILLLFVPVLLTGEFLALNKARSSLLETARKNLTESAAIKGDKITDAIAGIKLNLNLASQTRILKSGSPIQVEEFLTRLVQQSPTYIECIQLTNVRTDNVIASTCGDQSIPKLTLPLPDDGVAVEAILPPKIGTTGKRDTQNQLQLLFSVPVYDRAGKLHYALNLKSVLHKQVKNKRGSLTGSTVVIAEDGTILAHPMAERVGSNILEHPDASRLQSIVKKAIAGKKESVELYLKEGTELIAGYTAIPNPLTTQQNKKWIILAVTSLDNALYGLGEIKLILITLTVGLTGASLLALLYLARSLARPVEELRDYALNLNSHHAAAPVPHNFKIREFNQLAQALDQMVERLKAWAEELEMAWKDAKGANQSKSHFLATTSHELRNPLNIIINCVRVVREDLCDNREEELEFLKRADDTAIHLLGIINDLLDISKIEAGKLSVVKQPLDLRQLLLDVINIQSINVQQKGLQLKVIDQSCEPIPVNADPAKLKQVIINVIGNATKFTDEGSITVKSEIRQVNNGKSVVIVSVKDTGMGIEPTQQHQLFRPFVMIDATTRKVEGTGLGLAISRNLMELMGGSITLNSAGLHQGTTVSITLPLIDASLLSSPPGQGGSTDVGKSSGENSEPKVESHLKKLPVLPSGQTNPIIGSHFPSTKTGADGEVGIWKKVQIMTPQVISPTVDLAQLVVGHRKLEVSKEKTLPHLPKPMIKKLKI
jgi:two-component system, NarL family, sensor histidine kinase BarA